jgi:hypothetical protein
MRDIAGSTSNAVGLDRLDWLIRAGLEELSRHPFPETVLHAGPDDRSRLEAIHFASFIVAHRAERLLQLTELSASALDNLEHGSLQLAAIAARALFEIAAVTAQMHAKLEVAWRRVHGSAGGVEAVASDPESELWTALWEARLGSRLEQSLAAGWPKAVHVMDAIRNYGEDPQLRAGAKDLYAWLCEATHPSSESQAVFWRLEKPDHQGRQRVRFEPSASQSPVKSAVTDAIRHSYAVIVAYCRDLWWVAAEVASVCRFGRDEDTRSLGLPLVGGRNDLCCCGSGVKTKACGHPEPRPLSAEWEPAGNDSGNAEDR